MPKERISYDCKPFRGDVMQYRSKGRKKRDDLGRTWFGSRQVKKGEVPIPRSRCLVRRDERRPSARIIIRRSSCWKVQGNAIPGKSPASEVHTFENVGCHADARHHRTRLHLSSPPPPPPPTSPTNHIRTVRWCRIPERFERFWKGSR